MQHPDLNVSRPVPVAGCSLEWLVLSLFLLFVVLAGAWACGLVDSEPPSRASVPFTPPSAAVPGQHGCLTNLDCSAGERCVSGRCFQTCATDDGCGGRQSCRQGLCARTKPVCDDWGCLAANETCVPLERWCGEAGPVRCASNGMPLPLPRCEPGFSCVEGGCYPVVCEGSEPAICDGEAVVVCHGSDNRVRALIACDPIGLVCAEGACVHRVCEPGERRCDGRSVWRCEDGLTGWAYEESCGELEICEAGRCLPSMPCRPGEPRCDGNAAVVCRLNQRGFQVVETCEGICLDGACRPGACSVGSTWCLGEVAQACDAGGRVLGSQPCVAGTRCLDGQCAPILCASGEAHCREGRRAVCDVTGTAWELVDCPPGDICRAGECLPEGTQLSDGAACDLDDDCLSGQCVRGPDFPGGYCSRERCESALDCVGGGLCVRHTPIPFCAAPCSSDADCRGGYQCTTEDDVSVCRAVGDPGPFGPSFPFATLCDSDLLQLAAFMDGSDLRQIHFRTGPSQTGLFAGFLHLGGGPIRPWELVSGQAPAEPLAGTFPIYDNNALRLGNLNGVLIPAAPQHAHYVAPGLPHRLSFSAPDDSACVYVIPTHDEGRRIDLNLIAVGAEGIVSEDGGLDESAASLVGFLDEILQKSGLTSGRVRVSSATADTVERFAILRREDQLQELVSSARPPGSSVEEALSVDVFVVRDIALGVNAVGISAGLPGLAGLHGFAGTGLALSSASLSDDPRFVAGVLAHELGHFLGLAHTTEAAGGSLEPINDTPQCGQIIAFRPTWCPDSSNLMFPFAIAGSHDLSAGQQFVLRMSPLTKHDD